MIVLQIITTIITPIFILIAVGVLMGRLFSLDLMTLSKLNFYVFVPAIMLTKLQDSKPDPALFGVTAGFNIILMALLLAVSWALFSAQPLKACRPILTMGTLFNNCGNYGIPLAQLAFGDLGVQVMAVTLMVQNVVAFTLGLWLVGSGRGRWQDAVKRSLKAPVIYAIAAALLLGATGVKLPSPLYQALEYLDGGLVPIALITLGVQLSRSRASTGRAVPLTAVTLVRLILSPLLAAGLAALWTLAAPEQMAAIGPVLVAGAGLPVAVNVYILAVEYGREPEMASQMVFWTTILSALTLTAWLAVYR